MNTNTAATQGTQQLLMFQSLRSIWTFNSHFKKTPIDYSLIYSVKENKLAL